LTPRLAFSQLSSRPSAATLAAFSISEFPFSRSRFGSTAITCSLRVSTTLPSATMSNFPKGYRGSPRTHPARPGHRRRSRCAGHADVPSRCPGRASVTTLTLLRKFKLSKANFFRRVIEINRYGGRMLDGKQYYAAFPDEDPHKRCLLALLTALENLEDEFRRNIQQFWATATSARRVTSYPVAASHDDGSVGGFLSQVKRAGS
jgi:hypothetical protein